MTLSADDSHSESTTCSLTSSESTTNSFTDEYSESWTSSSTVTSSTSRTTSTSISGSKSGTPSYSFTSSVSTSDSASESQSLSSSSTQSDSPTITIDPCNTTFRDDSTSFIRRVTLLNDVAYGVVNSSDATFLVLNRVQLAAMRTMRLQVGFNTYLRNFYYNTSLDWFPLPKVSNCIASGFELVNATDFVVRVDYNPDVSLAVGVNNDYFCNLTFSTDIFQCQLMTNFTFNFSATILVTGTPAVLSSVSQTSVTVMSALVAFLSGGAALLQQSRAESLGQLTACQFSLVDQPSAQDCPMQIGFGSELQFYYRGCVVGNIGAIAVFLAAVLAVVLVASLLCRREVHVWEYVAPPTASASEVVHIGEESAEKALGGSDGDQYLDTLADALLLEMQKAEIEEKTKGVGHDHLQGLPNSSEEHSSDNQGEEAAVPKILAFTRMETFREAFNRLCGRLAFPSIGALPVGLLADSTILASVRLLAHPIDENDNLIGGIGIAFYGVILVVLLVCTLAAVVKRSPTPVKLRKTNPLSTDHKVGSYLRYWLLPTTDFESERRRDRHRYGMLKFLFEDSRYPVFIVCDLALSILIAGLVGVGTSRRELCAKLAIAGTAGYGLFFLCVLALRPDLTRLNLMLNIIAAGLGFLSSIVTLVSMDQDALGLTSVGQYISLVMLVIILLQFVATAIAIVAFARALAKLMRERRATKAAAAVARGAGTGVGGSGSTSTDQFGIVYHINIIRNPNGDEVDSCSDDDNGKDDDIIVIVQEQQQDSKLAHLNSSAASRGGTEANIDGDNDSLEMRTLPIFQELDDDDCGDDGGRSDNDGIDADIGLEAALGRLDEEPPEEEEFDRIWMSLRDRSSQLNLGGGRGHGKRRFSSIVKKSGDTTATAEQLPSRPRGSSMLLTFLHNDENEGDEDDSYADGCEQSSSSACVEDDNRVASPASIPQPK
ncbi:transmembrane protein, putative [Bodo saltans]|uniref:Transmembrane protein, putative n=1 Tax=Bodo saltans TaxID=75058 RepID=A0A0S4JSN1_BODSA|nr:transmembrane protein, putative [Bodo saltans]|eukprot:CUG93291.1 transmembrane protein, putative [Bodo saltans]